MLRVTQSVSRVMSKRMRLFSSSDPKSYESMKANDWLVRDDSAQNSKTTHWSASEEFISRIPVVMVDQSVVRCSGGPVESAGHPVVYIKCDHGKPSVCKYCGLRFQLKEGGH